jgi:hypothetical protein
MRQHFLMSEVPVYPHFEGAGNAGDALPVGREFRNGGFTKRLRALRGLTITS